MFIARSTIDKVFETAVIEEVIGDFITLRKSGANYKALSPFSDEKTPSFMVSPSKGIWKDFSSGKGGTLVSFLMEHEHYTYPEALVYLAKKYNIPVETVHQTKEQKQKRDQRESLYLVLEFAQKFYKKNLWEQPQGKAIGLSYFRERGFTDEVIENFDLGYNLDTWTNFTDAALAKGFRLEFLEKVGLTIVKDKDKKFDRFKGRVLFPVQSISGRVLGFGGRTLKADKNIAKYLNSPESEIYHKSAVLYGIYQAKKDIVKNDLCYLVEGYTDVIALHQKGVKNVVASAGTALTEQQIKLIKRFTPHITLLFDGDTAGLDATMRGIDLILAQGMHVRIVLFPEGQDPDSFTKAISAADLQTYLQKNTKDFIHFKTQIFQKQSEKDPIKKGALIRDIVATISKIPNDIQKEIYVRSCAAILKISEPVLFRELSQIQNNFANAPQNKLAPRQIQLTHKKNPQELSLENTFLEACEREILKILLLYPNEKFTFEDKELKRKDDTEAFAKKEYSTTPLQEIYLQLQADEIDFANENFRLIYEMIKKDFEAQKNIDARYIKKLSQHEDKVISEIVTNILMEDEKYSLSRWEEKGLYSPTKKQQLSRWINDALLNIRTILVTKKINQLQKEIQNIQTDRQIENQIKQEVMDYCGLKNTLCKFLTRIV